MDWAHDDACLSTTFTNATKLFKYESQPTTVVKMVKENNYQIQIWSLETESDWKEWMQNQADNIGGNDGLILILAKRAGEQCATRTTTTPVTILEWLEMQSVPVPDVGIRRANTLAALGEKSYTTPSMLDTGAVKSQKSVRTLPFSSDTFRSICEKFQVHESIIRAVSRSDIPVFSCESVNMGEPAYVYNCRTSNSWDLDLALSATYFPRTGLTYTIVYGCPLIDEKSILKRLSTVQGTAVHPLLLPGILVELELSRHARLVESSINDVEAKIFELDSQPNIIHNLERTEIESRNEAKRSAWLDLTYLRNSLTTWNAQIRTMSNHADELEHKIFDKMRNEANVKSLQTRRKVPPIRRSRSHSHVVECPVLARSISIESPRTNQSTQVKYVEEGTREHEAAAVHGATLANVGSKIKRRLDTIQDEYDEKIRDCTMRVDGMAMATQWSHGETTVEMAMATNKESNIMKSISLVTMVFLPGTFFATVFSMTFFDWKAEGSGQVSSYLWIYVVVTVIFTTITIGLWYYFVIFRRTIKKDPDKGKTCMV